MSNACATCGKSAWQDEQTLTKKYGVRPRHYRGFLRSKDPDWQTFAAALPEVTKFTNARLRANGSRVRMHPAELATNVLAEGLAATNLKVYGQYLYGFEQLGIDTIVDRRAELAPWLHPSVQQLVDDPRYHDVQLNERHESVTSLKGLTLRQGLYANAAMYAWAKDQAAHDLARHGVAMDGLPAEEQFYWGTLYFNAGPDRARRLMDKYGAALARTRWPHGEDAAYRMDARYNASWRTATYELIRPLTDTTTDRALGRAKHPWE